MVDKIILLTDTEIPLLYKDAITFSVSPVKQKKCRSHNCINYKLCEMNKLQQFFFSTKGSVWEDKQPNAHDNPCLLLSS